jgi:sugar (glycoside-pentoside-hexuronide) transporter
MLQKSRDTLLSIQSKWAYGTGDFGLNLFWSLTTFFLMYFYTDVYGISPVQAGTIYFIARLWDAISDPMMGYIADKNHSRWGKFRPYLLFGSVPLALTAIAAFSTPSLGSVGKFYWALSSYIALSTLYTLVSLPYSSLLASMSQNTIERSSLAGIRMVFAASGTLLVAVAAKPLIALFPSEQQGFQVVVAGYAVIGVAALWFCFANTRERYCVVVTPHYTVKNIVAMLKKNKPLLLLSASMLATATADAAKKASTLYFLKYNVGREDLFAAFALIGVIGVVVGIFLSLSLKNRMAKRDIYLLGIAIYVLADIAVWFISLDQLFFVFVFSAMASLGAGMCLSLVWSMCADTIEYGQWVSGMRAEGIINSFFSFMQKLASAIGALLVGVILQESDYIANQEQSSDVISGIFSIMFIVPVIAGIVAALIISKYPLNKKRFDQLLKDLQQSNT